jgi:hypothetical protein
MAVDALPAVLALNQRYLLDFPHEAARRLEAMPAEEVAALFAAQPPHAWRAQRSRPTSRARSCVRRRSPLSLAESEPAAALRCSRSSRQARERLLARSIPQVASELRGAASGRLAGYGPQRESAACVGGRGAGHLRTLAGGLVSCRV